MPKVQNVLKKPRRRFIELSDDDAGFSDAQFERPAVEIPYKSIFLAAFLFIVGATGIIVGALIETGYIQAAEWLDRGKPFLILGSIMFIPGAYHVYLAYYAWHNTPGYDFGMIPDLD